MLLHRGPRPFGNLIDRGNSAKAGLHIGSRLMGAYEGNVRGHFEDLDFYEFHVAVLAALGLRSEGFESQAGLRVNAALVSRRRR